MNGNHQKLANEKLDESLHGLRTPREEIAFTARPKIHSHSQLFRYGRSIFCLPHRPNFSDIFDLSLHWVSVVGGAKWWPRVPISPLFVGSAADDANSHFEAIHELECPKLWCITTIFVLYFSIITFIHFDLILSKLKYEEIYIVLYITCNSSKFWHISKV